NCKAAACLAVREKAKSAAIQIHLFIHCLTSGVLHTCRITHLAGGPPLKIMKSQKKAYGHPN
ncbi:MAG: hypothetical protein Q6367_017080, partial [Candidatus Freyarchaeota archaeon]